MPLPAAAMSRRGSASVPPTSGSFAPLESPSKFPQSWKQRLPTYSKLQVLFTQNGKRWLVEALLLLVGCVYIFRVWQTFVASILFTVFFEWSIRSRRLRNVRNSQPYKLYGAYCLLYGFVLILMDGYFMDLTRGLLFGSSPRHLSVWKGEFITAPPPQMLGQSTIDRSAVIVKDGEAVRVPFTRTIDATFRAIADKTLDGEAYVTGDDVSIIIPVRDESEYLSKTIMYTVQNTPRQYIREFIIVDDGSDENIADVLDRELPRNVRGLVKVLRFDVKEGLIRARITGADMATSSNIFFLDGHCRPKPGWVEPLIRHLKTNYKRIACPVIQDIAAETWEETGTSGFKMMFEWNFEFGWYDDLTDEVPISAGGILAMTKKWWGESGKYDPGMLEWGGENIEQSIRVWLCGGEIYVVRNSQIGHIFNRPAKPNPENRLVTQVQKNQKRAALVWLDDYYKLFETHHSVVKTLDAGEGLEERVALRHKLRCKPFQWYVDRFRTAFERKGLLESDFFHVQHLHSRWCLGIVGPNPVGGDEVEKQHHHVMLMPCDKYSKNQQWQAVGGQRMMYHRQTGKCLDSFGSQKGSLARDKRPIVYDCDWNGVFQISNTNQFWQFDATKRGRIFSYESQETATLTGNDVFPVLTELSINSTSLCLSADLPHWNAWDWTSDDAHFKQHNRYARDVYYTTCRDVDNSMAWADKQSFHALW